MIISQNIDLKGFNSFGVSAKVRNMITITDNKLITQALSTIEPSEIIILGGGSNTLFTKDIYQSVLFINTHGIDIIKSDKYNIWVKINAGENWNDIVEWALARNLGGIENLSLIPGKVGAAPIQNIGAYGCEIKDVLEAVETIDINSSKKKTFNNADCQFSYRNSIFKERKNQYLILSVTIKLSRYKHKINYSYRDIKAEISKNNISKPTIRDISNLVKKIRNQKLPNPDKLGNAGSFFKNPIISRSSFETIQMLHPNISHFYVDENNVKVSAAWLIEQCQWKGKSIKQTAVHSSQPLVIINKGNASGKDIIYLSQKIKKSVIDKFNITLVEEINII